MHSPSDSAIQTSRVSNSAGWRRKASISARDRNGASGLASAWQTAISS